MITQNIHIDDMNDLCFFVYSDVHHIMRFCFVCLRLVNPMLPVSLDCLFLIAHSVFSDVYLPKQLDGV